MNNNDERSKCLPTGLQWSNIPYLTNLGAKSIDFMVSSNSTMILLRSVVEATNTEYISVLMQDDESEYFDYVFRYGYPGSNFIDEIRETFNNDVALYKFRIITQAMMVDSVTKMRKELEIEKNTIEDKILKLNEELKIIGKI